MFNLDEFVKALRIFLGMETPPKPIYIPIDDEDSHQQRHGHRRFDQKNYSDTRGAYRSYDRRGRS